MFPSQKMGVTIQFESHRNELAWIYEFENDPDVLEYYDQPPAIELDYELSSGRRHRNRYTPDFFVIRNNSAGYVECKLEKDLLKRSKKNPHYYRKQEDDAINHLPGESYAECFGLYFHVYADTDICRIRQRNFRWLEDYFNIGETSVNPEVEGKLVEYVKHNLGLTLADLLKATQTTATADDIYILITQGKLYVNLDVSELAKPDQAYIFTSEEIAFAHSHLSDPNEDADVFCSDILHIKVGEIISWDGKPWRIANLGISETTLVSNSGEYSRLINQAFEDFLKSGAIKASNPDRVLQNARHDEKQNILLQASEKHIEEANQRYRRIEPFLRDSSLSSSSRSVRRWLKQYREAEASLGNGYLGLIPKPRSGNRDRRLDDFTFQLMGEFIANNYENPKNRSAISVYQEFCEACKSHERAISPPSYKTFCREIKSRSGYQQILKRQGKRVAIQHETFYWHLDITTPRHGDRPFEIGHIDHSQGKLELLASLQSLSQCVVNVFGGDTNHKLGKPWITMMIDAYSRRILAVYISFEPPSYRSCMMVIRICVQRYNRFPQTIVTDNGAEFHSHYYEQLLAYYACTKKNRPPAKSRFSNVMERLFGIANDQFVYELEGNTQLTRNRRQVTKTVNPKNHATWTLGEFYERFCQWAYEVYDNRPHTSLGCSPREAYEYGIAVGGERLHKRVEYDNNFKIMTLPNPKGRTRKVQRSRGISIDGWYWSEAFCNPEVEGTKVEVRYDPFDLSFVYAFVKGQWVRCIAQNYQALKGRTEKEKQLFSAEIKKRKQIIGQSRFDYSTELNDFLASTRAQEDKILKARLQALDTTAVVQAIEVNADQPTVSSYINDESVTTIDTKAETTNTEEETADETEVYVDMEEEEFEFYGRF